MKAVNYTILLVMLLVSHAASASVAVFGTSSESKQARQFSPPPGKAIVYIYQRSQDGTDVSPKIWLNNYEIGRLVPGSFTVWKLAPGRLTIHVDGTEPATISTVSKAGQVYLYRIAVTQTNSGLKAQLTGLTEAFRPDLLATRLLKNPRTVSPSITQAPVTPATPANNQVAKSTPPPNKPVVQPQYEPETPIMPGGIGLMIKAGSLTLSQETQTILGSDWRFDDSASSPLAMEVYYQFDSGITVGGEILSYAAEFTTLALTQKHDVDVLILFGNAKQYFRRYARFQPYIGAGLGVATTDISGPSISGNTSGLAYQLMAGVEYRSADFGVFGEVKTVGADTEDDASQSVDVSGSGLFAGISFYF